MRINYKNILLGLGFISLMPIATMAVQVSKEVWLPQVQAAMPAMFCKEDSFFITCYKVSHDECIQVAKDTTSSCVEMYESKIPAVLNQPNDGSQWGRTLGSCAGAAYSNVLQKKFRTDSANCMEIERKAQERQAQKPKK